MRTHTLLLGVLLLFGSCQTFIVDCIEYDRSNPDIEYCLQCTSDTVLSEDKLSCQGCTNGCKTCDPLDRKKCLSCPEGRFLNGTNCDYCTAGCKICQNPDTCQSCISGLYLDRFGGCSPCSLGCKNCESAYRCTECINGFIMTSTGCVMKKTDNQTDNNSSKRAPDYPAPPRGPSGGAIFLYVFLGVIGALLFFGFIVSVILQCCGKQQTDASSSVSNTSVKRIHGDSSFLHTKITNQAAARGHYVSAGTSYPLPPQHNNSTFNPPVVVNSNNPFI